MASIKFLDKAPFSAKFRQKQFPRLSLRHGDPFRIKVNETLPFRIKFTSIGVPSYGPTNIPPIGVAIIGFNNYIL